MKEQKSSAREARAKILVYYLTGCKGPGHEVVQVSGERPGQRMFASPVEGSWVPGRGFAGVRKTVENGGGL